MKSLKITNGLYLVVDPGPGEEYVLPRLEAALAGGVDVVQLWSRWRPEQSAKEFIMKACRLVHRYEKPILIHEHWEWLNEAPLDGVHFDVIPENWKHVTDTVNRPFLAGITCRNREQEIDWAIEHGLDYLSFCSMYPSSSTDSCELVHPDTVRRVRALTTIPLFGAGGVTTENIPSLLAMGLDGVAVVSAVMKAPDPEAAARALKTKLANSKKTAKE